MFTININGVEVYTDGKTWAEVEVGCGCRSIADSHGEINIMAGCPLTWYAWNNL